MLISLWFEDDESQMKFELSNREESSTLLFYLLFIISAWRTTSEEIFKAQSDIYVYDVLNSIYVVHLFMKINVKSYVDENPSKYFRKSYERRKKEKLHKSHKMTCKVDGFVK